MTIIDLLVASTMSLVVIGVLVAGLLAGMRTDRYTDQDTQSLAELRSANERLVKELRQAAKIFSETKCSGSMTGPPSEWKRRLRFWVDSDGDGQQDAVERIEWRLVPTGDGQAELTRRTDAAPEGPGITYARHLIDGEAFDCNAPPPQTDLVEITFTSDEDPNRYAVSRKVRTEVSLRNVPD